jgi:hypothetical protein
MVEKVRQLCSRISENLERTDRRVRLDSLLAAASLDGFLTILLLRRVLQEPNKHVTRINSRKVVNQDMARGV